MGLLEDIQRDLKRSRDLLGAEEEGIEAMEKEEHEKERKRSKALDDALEDASAKEGGGTGSTGGQQK